jgi:hypothetical protein
LFLGSRKYDPDPGVKKAPDPGSATLKIKKQANLGDKQHEKPDGSKQTVGRNQVKK